MRGARPCRGAAAYEAEMHEAFGHEPPVFDLILLGPAPTCTPARSSPATTPSASASAGPWAWRLRAWLPGVQDHAYLPVVNAARSILFLVTGEDKAEAVARAFDGPPDPRAPASLVEPVSGSLELICDEQAAARL